jgi:hypothetical protein
MPARSGVRWFTPASPTSAHAGGAQETEAPVRGRVETLPVTDVKVAGLAAACPWMSRLVASPCASSAVNWIQADVIVAPDGMANAVKRSPTRWLVRS